MALSMQLSSSAHSNVVYNIKNPKHFYMVMFDHVPSLVESHENYFNTQCRDDMLQKASDQPAIPLEFESYASVLKSCSDIKSIQQLHASLLTSGLGKNVFLGARLLSMYAMCGSMEGARLVFDKMHETNVFIWNAMIRAYARNGPSEEALTLYYQMQRLGMEPDKFTFPFVLKACAAVSALQEGKQIHEDIVRVGFDVDLFVGNSLIAMYAKCRRVEMARQVFDKMPERDVVSWNSIIVGCAENGHEKEALTLFKQMQLAEFKPDSITVTGVLQACANLGALQAGKMIHSYIIRNEYGLYASVGNSLIAMYAKSGDVQVARHVFDKMSERDAVSWNAIIAGYAQNGHASDALSLFHQMQLADVPLNSVTMVSVLPACGHLAALQEGKRMHGYIVRRGFDSDIVVGTALIDMYAKFGSVNTARQLFDHMSQRNVVSWNAMIAGYAQEGHCNEALALFIQMQLANMKPNSVTIVSVLPACAHLAALHQGI